jgi:hypothetical protein
MTRAPNFDPVARVYRWAEYLTLGPLLQRIRTHFLPQLVDCRRALVLGDGDGRFLAELLQQNRGLQAVAVDTSAVMLDILCRRCDALKSNETTRLRTWHGSALGIQAAKDTDLIVTHFFLDCFSQAEIDSLASRMAQQTQPGTLWLLSDFRAGGPVSRVYVRSLYFAFRVLTGLRVTRLPDPAAALSAAGFQRVAQHQSLSGILYTELWQR